MDDNELQNYLHGLGTARPSTPRHQERLRAQLSAAHQRMLQQSQESHRPRRFQLVLPKLQIKQASLWEGVNKMNMNSTNSRRRWARGAAAGLAVTAVVVGAVAFGAVPGTQQASAAELLQRAAEKTQQMSAADIAAIESRSKVDLEEALSRAGSDSDLRLVKNSEYAAFGIGGAKEVPGVQTYLVHTDDTSGDRIVVALGEDGEPVYVLNVDQPAVLTPAQSNTTTEEVPPLDR